MMVANAFDLWQKDAFFSAAEEVQESADSMESNYREWDRAKKEAPLSHDLNYLSRDLQTALGTAKWQLDEFEKAIKLSYGHQGDKYSVNRHEQFISAIRFQISRVESELQESLCEKGKQPLRWVNLNEEERDDLALFLCGAVNSKFVEHGNSSSDDYGKKEEAESSGYSASSRALTEDSKGFKDIKIIEDKKIAMEIESLEVTSSREDMKYAGARRTWSSPNFGDWKIVIADDDAEKNKLLPSVEATPKEKGSKGIFSKQRFGERVVAKLATTFFNRATTKSSASAIWMFITSPAYSNANNFFNCAIRVLCNVKQMVLNLKLQYPDSGGSDPLMNGIIFQTHLGNVLHDSGDWLAIGELYFQFIRG